MPVAKSQKGKAKAKTKPYEPSTTTIKQTPGLDKSNAALHLQILRDDLNILQYTSHILPPEEYFGYEYELLSFTQTKDEISIVISSPDPVDRAGEHERADNVLGPMSGIKVKGPLEMSMIGVLASLTATLRDASVSVFVVSTWNTDYVLVPKKKLETAKEALQRNGWIVETSKTRNTASLPVAPRPARPSIAMSTQRFRRTILDM